MLRIYLCFAHSLILIFTYLAWSPGERTYHHHPHPGERFAIRSDEGAVASHREEERGREARTCISSRSRACTFYGRTRPRIHRFARCSHVPHAYLESFGERSRKGLAVGKYVHAQGKIFSRLSGLAFLTSEHNGDLISTFAPRASISFEEY